MSTDVTRAPSSPFAHVKAPNWNPEQGMQVNSMAPQSFQDLYLSDELCRGLAQVNYTTPTPVQASCIPLVLAGIDLIVQSQTGTGKTAAFAIPTLELLEAGTKRVEALILAPTRELARQVAGEFSRLSHYKDIPVACVYGGTGFQQQLEELETAQIVCATPGRLLDLLKRRALTLDHLKLFILDEADEMLNMGFEKELDAIVERLPDSRQALLFSATVGEDIKRISSHILTYPEFVSHSSDSVVAQKVQHLYYMVTGLGRLWDLMRVVAYENPENAIVFCNTRDDSFLVANFLRKQGFEAEVLNGDLPQKAREETLARLRKNQIRFLVATDVAARGIDISDLSHVINFHMPDSPETYVHRTGRTGRAGKRGVALSLISPREIGTYYFLRRIYKLDLQERELPTAAEVAAVRQQRAVDTLLERLSSDASLAYAEHLSYVDGLLSQPDAKAHIAKLLAFYQGSTHEPVRAEVIDEAALRARVAQPPAALNGTPTNGAVKGEPAKPAVAKETPVKAKAAPKEEPAPVEVKQAEPAAQPPAPAEAEPVQEAAEPVAEAPSTAAPAASEEPADGDRRRRRRKRRPRLVVEEPPVVEEQEAPVLEVATEPAPEEVRELDREDESVDLNSLHVDLIEEPTQAVEDVNVQGTNGGFDDILATIHAPREMSRLHLNIGTSRIEDEDRMVEILCDLAGLEPEDFGTIELRRRFSFIEARSDMLEDIMEAINGQRVEGISLRIEPARR